MNQILYEKRCKCKEEFSITKKRKSSNRSEGKPFLYPDSNEIISKTFQIKYERNLSPIAKFLLNSFQNKYLYYAIDDILYLFLLADLFCCAFVYTVFYSFYNKDVNERTAYIAIVIGLIGGFLLFPFPDFSKSLLVGVLISKELFSPFILQSLLFLSFIVATFLPAIILKIQKKK